MPFLNPFTQRLKPSATLLINQKIKEMREQGETIYHFGFGQSPFPVPGQVVESLQANAHANSYLPTLGLPELRNDIAEFLGDHQSVNANADQVLIGPGSKELLYQSIVILDATYFIPKGSWVSYGPQITVANKECIVLETNFEDDFKLRSKTLEVYCKNANPGPKVLILNSPNNPTGAVYTLAELESLAKVCRAHDIIVFSDEIYSQLTFTEAHAPSMATLYPEGTFIFGGISKVFSAGGYRLGFLHLPKGMDYLQPVYRALFSETFSAVSAPIQYAARAAFQYGENVQEQVNDSKAILNTIGMYVFEALRAERINSTRPKGGFYLMIDFRNYKKEIISMGIQSSEELAHLLLEDYCVALLPGTDFYFSPEELVFRLAFVDFDGKKALDAYQKNKNRPLDLKFIRTFAPNIINGVQKLIDFTNNLS